MTLHFVLFNKNEISLIGKLSSDFGLLSKMKFNLGAIFILRKGKGVGGWYS